MTDVDVAVIGGGVVGLASALALAGQGHSVCVLESHARTGHGTSTRNSGVIHAGLYYPAGSLKARLCVRGRHLLYEFCERYGVPHARCGKLVVAATDADVPRLETLRAQADANGVEDLAVIDTAAVRAREPHVHAVAALWSPVTGIVEPEALVRTLAERCRAADVAILPGSPLIGAESAPGGLRLTTPQEIIVAAQVVNAAGLYADHVSALLGGETFTIYPCRGEYAELRPARCSMVHGLVYPLPHKAGHGLGVHLTRTTWGSVLIGPTIHYQESRDDYERDRLPLEDFVAPTQVLLPSITQDDLQLASSGIRAKLCPPSEDFADFLVRRDRVNPRVIQAAGIDSPGLTSCLAIAEVVTAEAGA